MLEGVASLETTDRSRERAPTVFFGSYYRGLWGLDDLLHGRLKDGVKVVGVATSCERPVDVDRPKEIRLATWGDTNYVVARLLQDHYGWTGSGEKLLRRLVGILFSILPGKEVSPSSRNEPMGERTSLSMHKLGVCRCIPRPPQ